MAGLGYVGPVPTNPTDVVTGNTVTTIINGLTPNRTSVASQIQDQVDTVYASKSLVDTTHATFVTPSYYQTQDALNLAPAQVGAANGAAALDASGKVPLAQMPNLGEGYLRGPWGPTNVYNGATDKTPLYIGDWQIGEAYLAFRPLVFLLAFVAGTMGSQPIIEVWLTDIAPGSDPPSYAVASGSSSTLVTRAVGRYGFSDYHTVAAFPGCDTLGQTFSLLPTSYQVWLSAWLYDLNDQGVTIAQGGIATGSAYLLRGAQ